jgi:tetratricopeptide (TPR) repeat protein
MRPFKLTLRSTSFSGSDATSTPASALPPNGQKHVQNRLDAMQAGKLQEAQKELIAAYNAAPKNAAVCYLPGEAYLKSKDSPHAQTYLGITTLIDPKNVPALVALGQLHHEQKGYDAAIKPLEKAASLDSKEWQDAQEAIQLVPV